MMINNSILPKGAEMLISQTSIDVILWGHNSALILVGNPYAKLLH